MRWFSLRCLLGGHDDLIAHEPGRLFLRCAHCGRETRGWEVAVRPPAPHLERPRQASSAATERPSGGDPQDRHGTAERKLAA